MWLLCWYADCEEKRKKRNNWIPWSSLFYTLNLYHYIPLWLLLAVWNGQENTSFPFFIKFDVFIFLHFSLSGAGDKSYQKIIGIWMWDWFCTVARSKFSAGYVPCGHWQRETHGLKLFWTNHFRCGSPTLWKSRCDDTTSPFCPFCIHILLCLRILKDFY